MKQTYETDPEQLQFGEEYQVFSEAINLFWGKLLIWLAISTSLLTLFLSFVAPQTFAIKINLPNFSDVDKESLTVMTYSFATLSTLFYVLPILLVKTPKTLRAWAIVWLVLAVLSVIFLPFSIKMMGTIPSFLGLVSTVFILLGSIIIIVKTSQTRR